MGIFDPDIASALERLTRSPRVQYGVREGVNLAKRAFPILGGPLLPNIPKIPRTGAAPRQGSQYKDQGNIFGSAVGSTLVELLGQQGQPQDPMAALYDQLVSQLQAPVSMPQGVDTEDLMRQIRGALDPIYDERASRAQGQSDRARSEVKDMYRELSNDYERLAPQQIEQAAAAQEEIKQMYGQLRSNIEGNYSRVSKEQGDLFKQLGIEAALPDVLEEQEAPVQEALTAASENQTQQQQRYMDIGQMDSTYYREGSPLATMTGNQISTDLLSQLQDYLGQNEAERTAGIQGAYLDQLNQANSLLAQQQQAAQSEAGRRQEMLFQMLQSTMQGRNQAQQQALTPDTFMSGLPEEQQQAVAGAFTRLQRSPEAIYGKVEDKRNPVPGTFVETTPEWYMAQADEMLRRGEIDPVTHQALLMYMQLYLKSGR